MRLRLVAISIVLAGTATGAAAEALGRLFFTPEQRALLDTARRTMPMHVGGETPAPSTPEFTLRGIVTRSDGARSVWLNDRVDHGKGGVERNQVRLAVPGGQVNLKVGQSIDPTTGRVVDGYRRPPPEAPKAAADPPRDKAADKPPEASAAKPPRPTHEDDDERDPPTP